MPAGKLLRRYHNASLAQRIVFWFLLMVLVPTLLLAFITDRLSSASLREKIDEQLITLVEAKANRLETYAYERTRAASVLGRVRRIANAAIALQNVGKDTLDKSELENDIRTVAYYFMENLGFTNFILLAPQGDVLFQTQDQLPLGGNLLSGPQRDSELAQVVKRAMTLLEPDISNFAMYPGMEQPLGFVAGPIVSEAGRLVGLLVLQLNTQEVFETFNDYTGLGRTGFTVAAALDGDEVRIVAPLRHHPDAAFNLSVRLGDRNGEIIQKAVLGEQGVGEMRNIDGVPGFAAWTYAPSFRWGIGVQVGLDEAMELIAQQRHAMLILLASILIPAALIALFVARSISRPITQAVHAAEQVAAGDLSIRLDSHGDDETGKLLQALGRMVDYLNSLVGQVQRSTIELISITNTLAAMTRAQGDEATSLGATTSEIAAAAKEISATSEELVNTMTDATEGAATTTVLATNGQVGLNEMEQAMRHLAEATHSISGKLGAISDKANNINSVTTTIAKIADQTNLLSLNASIEAEKAGEYGLGFAVLAREIRRLADQTAVATLDIEQMVKEMQGAVAGGVMEMDKFSEQMRAGVAETNRISRQFVEIIDQVQDLTPRFEAVHEGMRSQSAGARQISDAMVSLADSARASIHALEETNGATQRLEAAIGDLRREISIFKLS